MPIKVPSGVRVEALAQLECSGCGQGRVSVWRSPVGTTSSAKELNRILLSAFPESAIFRTDTTLRKPSSQYDLIPVLELLFSNRSGIVSTLKVSRSRWQRTSAYKVE